MIEIFEAMTPLDGIQKMCALYDQIPYRAPLYSSSLHIIPTIKDIEITLLYPGKKDYGDYLLTVMRTSWLRPEGINHYQMCDYLVKLVNNNFFSYSRCMEILEDVYNYGLRPGHYEDNEALLRLLLFWVPLQEDINYPPSERYEGRRLAFKRYAEALETTLPDSQYTLSFVWWRIQKKVRHCNLLILTTFPAFYTTNPFNQRDEAFFETQDKSRNYSLMPDIKYTCPDLLIE